MQRITGFQSDQFYFYDYSYLKINIRIDSKYVPNP